MKNLPIISASLLIGSLIISSCSTNKMAASTDNDNLYFMASDVKLATQYAVANNNPESFEKITLEPELAEQNFSTRNVNPEYISRYQATDNSGDSNDGVVYFDEGTSQQTASGDINAYDNYSVAQNGNGSNAPNINFNFGMGFGYGGMMMSPWGFYDPFWGPGFGMGPAWGWRPGLSIGLGFGWGNPWRNPYMGMGFGWGYPMYPAFGWGYPMYPGFGYPVYPGYPSYILPGGEYGDRRVVYGARPTRGSSLTGSGLNSNQAGVMPSTARSQARNNASAATNPSARRLVSSDNSRVSTRDFSNSQSDYYNSSRSRTATTRNISSAASDRGSATTRTRSSIPSARTTNAYSPSNNIRNYTQQRVGTPASNGRVSNPSYNRGSSPSYNRNSTPSYNRSTSPTNNRSVSPTNRTMTPSRSNSSPSFSAPSRSSGGSMSAPSRSSGGSSGGSVGGSRGGRGN